MTTRRVLQAGAALTTLALMGSTVQANAITRKPTRQRAAVIELARMPTSIYASQPAVLLTGSGATLVTWGRDGSGADDTTLEVRRAKHVSNKKTPRFKSVNVSMAWSGHSIRLDEGPQTYRDGKTIRIVSHGKDPADINTIGTYVWTSRNDGKSFAGPTRVYNNFGDEEMAPDGQGGFYAVSQLTGVSVIHVPNSLVGTVELDLTDRISSRGWIELATTGHDSTLLTMFFGGATTYLHSGTTAGQNLDIQLFGQLSGEADIAGDDVRAEAVVIHRIDYNDSKNLAVFARTINVVGGNATLVKEVRLSGKKESINPEVAVRALGNNGTFIATWTNTKGRVRVARTSKSGKWSRASTIADLKKLGYSNAGELAVDTDWVAVSSYNKKSSKRTLELFNSH